ncbi:MAG: amphi-Trp domain-containing protein [Natrialbaceae archaeon]
MTDHEEASESERTTIRPGRNFERTYRLDADDLGEFLIDLGEQLRDDETLTLAGEEWELPFDVGEPIGLEVDFDGVGEPELEIELEIPGRTDDRPPAVR